MGKSKAQDELMNKLIELYPTAYITDEVYIGDLIDECGYTMKEMQRELGHKPHKMFVDIVMRDSERTIAFEYHGEQHYSLVGNMTKTTADLIMNQQLDQEKSWILERIGIPLVAVPFDMYVDASVIEHMIDEANEQLEIAASKLTECPECGRRFPISQLPKGACAACIECAQEEYLEEKEKKENEYAKARRERAAERREARKAANKEKRAAEKAKKSSATGSSWRDFASDGTDSDEYKEAQKERAREYRKQKYQEWKNSPEYAAQKEEAKRRRKEEYQKQKAERAKQKLEERRRGGVSG